MNDDVLPPERASKRVSKAQTKITPIDTTFKTPEQAAAVDSLSVPVTLPEHPDADIEISNIIPSENPENPENNLSPQKKSRFNLQALIATKRRIALLIVVTLVILGGLTSFIVFVHANKSAAVVTPKLTITKPKAVPKLTTVPATLSGLLVDPSANQRPVTAVMIENSIDARPQAGLSQAGVVFEAVAEGGITRFMALYQDTQPTNVGPIRSARPYYIQWALGFDAGYAHVGGSSDGLADIKSWNVRDLDQFYNGNSYHRITTRQAPHNVYTGVDTLTQLEKSKGYTSSTYTGFTRKKEAPAKVPTARTIDLSLSGPAYNPHYDYNASTNSYSRSEAGSPQTDSNTSLQLSPKVVVAIVVPDPQGQLDSIGAYYSNYNPIGSGVVDVFQDGTLSTGTWHKASNTASLQFTDATGKPLNLDPGQTWITAVGSASSISYTP